VPKFPIPERYYYGLVLSGTVPQFLQLIYAVSQKVDIIQVHIFIKR